MAYVHEWGRFVAVNDLALSLGSQNRFFTTTEYVLGRYHLYDIKKEVFLVSADLKQSIQISVLHGRYPWYYWYRLA
jgi:hypothetical protein